MIARAKTGFHTTGMRAVFQDSTVMASSGNQKWDLLAIKLLTSAK
jgi:hypothetical protein